jgi:hypothetical protein
MKRRQPHPVPRHENKEDIHVKTKEHAYTAIAIATLFIAGAVQAQQTPPPKPADPPSATDRSQVPAPPSQTITGDADT